MNTLPTWRLRYTQLFVVCILGISLYVMVQSLSKGISKLETNLWQRKPLFSMFTDLRLKLGDRVFLQALVGKDGWLQYTAEHNLDDFQNALQFSPNSIQHKTQVLYEKMQAQHITLVIVIAPNKATIYPEKVPDEIRKMKEQSRLDLLISYFNQYGPPVLIDLRPALQAARHEQILYYKTDTHWNDLGAFVAYTEIMRFLSASNPELAPHKLQDFQLQNGKSAIMDISRLIGATSLLEPEVSLNPKFNSDITWITYDVPPPARLSRTPNDQLLKLLMYHDSFGVSLRKFLAPHFREAAFVSYGSVYKDPKTLNFVEQLDPNIVIIEFAERYMPDLEPFLSNLEMDTQTK